LIKKNKFISDNLEKWSKDGTGNQMFPKIITTTISNVFSSSQEHYYTWFYA